MEKGLVYEFGEFRMDRISRQLFYRGQPVPLTNKCFDLLILLVQSGGEILTKEHLIGTLWPDTFVEEGNLTQNISMVRKALAVDPSGERYIETVPRRGYRFSVPAREAVGMAGEDLARAPGRVQVTAPATTAPAPADAPKPEPHRMRLTRWGAVAAGVAVVAAGAISRGAYLAGRQPGIRSIAVLPLTNLSGDPNQEYFSDGTTDALISSLAQIHSLDVTSRTSIMRFKGTTKPLPEIGKELGVDAIVEGSVQRSGRRIRISTQLIRAATDKHLWADEYEGDASDALKLESEIAQAIAREIQARLTPEERRRLASARAVNPEAQDLALLGRYHYWRNNPTEFKLAIDYLNRAIAAQPDDAENYAELSDAWGSLYMFTPSSEVREHAYATARQALELDPENSDAHAALGDVFFADMDWRGAEREFQRSLELNADNLNACGCYVNLLIAMGRMQEAIDLGAHAVKVNPLSSWMYAWYGNALYNAHRYQEAVPAFQRAIELDAGNPFGYLLLSLVYQKLGRAPDAVTLLERPEFRTSGALAAAYAQSGRAGEARQILKRLTGPDSMAQAFEIAEVYLALGDPDRGLEWLAKSVDRKETGARFLKVSPEFDNIRADPRFQALVARLNLPD
ncbi:MAG: winged helix-turn-helix domain-containing protein [Acidobacteria bacterium]|nr:winged helix-turn-helix domain-containing protein [Acidobacteriota bacterium]